jgi:hypothetical protein
MPLLEALLKVLFQDGCETCCHVMLNFFWMQNSDLWPQFWVSGRARSCTQWDLENMVAVLWFQFGSSQKSSALWRTCGKAHSHCAHSIVSLLFLLWEMLPTNPNGMITLFATCYIITHPSDVMTVPTLAKFLFFLNIAVLPLHTPFSNDSWLFLNCAYCIPHVQNGI